MMRQYGIIALLVIIGGTAILAAQPDRFGSQLRSLLTQDPVVHGRDKIIGQLEILIDANASHPAAAEAMFHIATLLENENPAIGMTAKPKEALSWYRKAVETAAPGTPVWIKARKYLAGRLGKHDAAEAKKLLDEVAQASAGNWYALARLEADRMHHALGQRDFDQAEQHCRTLLNWYSDPARIPKNPDEKRQLDAVIAASGRAMVLAWSTAQRSNEERTQRIRQFAAAYPQNTDIAATADKAIKFATAHPAPPPNPTPIALTSSKPESRRWILTFGAAALVSLLLAAAVLMRRMQAR